MWPQLAESERTELWINLGTTGSHTDGNTGFSLPLNPCNIQKAKGTAALRSASGTTCYQPHFPFTPPQLTSVLLEYRHHRGQDYSVCGENVWLVSNCDVFSCATY